MNPEHILRRISALRQRMALLLRRRHIMADAVLRFDIAHLMVRHQEDFDQGWPLHGMIPVPGWPDRPQWEN